MEQVQFTDAFGSFRLDMAELAPLLCDDEAVFADPERKNALLTAYAQSVSATVSGERLTLPLSELAGNLRRKALWLQDFLRKQEWMAFPQGEGWFNSYYDNHGNRVEGTCAGQVRMMLTGQVFAAMSGTATPAQIVQMVRSADRYLYAPWQGGYRLNTDFQELKLDLGRMFGFAYGEKENGAVFSHMAVMYAYALYCRGFVREGWKALKALTDHADCFAASRIYPGLPEYFRADGRGMYHYLTGAASWYLLTMVQQVFGVAGQDGNLCIRPRLLPEQFDRSGRAALSLTFAGKQLELVFWNRSKKDYGEYTVDRLLCDGAACGSIAPHGAVIERQTLEALDEGTHTIEVILN